MDLKKELENLPQHTAGTVTEFTTKHDCIVGLQKQGKVYFEVFNSGERVQTISIPQHLRSKPTTAKTVGANKYRTKQVSILREAYPKKVILWVIIGAESKPFVQYF